jgi:hydrogenase small subunit
MDYTHWPDRLLGETDPSGVSRRDFLKVCTAAAAAVGLPASAAEKMAEKVASGKKPPVIWLHFQECTGCTESLLRTSHPGVAELILDLVSLEYHETLFAAAGRQIEEALHESIRDNAGKYICVVEGAIPTKDDGVFCQVGGRTAVDILEDVASKAGLVVAIGSCASFGGVAAAEPNPTGAKGVPQILVGKPVVALPGCPANPYNLLGTVLQYATLGTLPAVDDKGRPRFAYARTIHEDCERRPHFDAGRFVQKFGDESHRLGYCLYKVGCKGPATHANCSLVPFGEVGDSWPVGLGHPCIGCTEQKVAFRVPMFSTVDVERLTPPGTYAPIFAEQGRITPLATGVAGLVVGGLVGAGLTLGKKLSAEAKREEHPEEKQP